MMNTNFPMPEWYDRAIESYLEQQRMGFITRRVLKEFIQELNEEYDEYIEKDKDNYE